jgi:NADPH2:quinone reductase
MKAWLCDRFSDNLALRLAETPAPEPEPGRSRIRVEAAALNFSDLLLMRGAFHVKPPLPFSPGREIVGVIDAPAPGARFKAGDRVACLVPWGGFAQFALIDDAHAFAVPDDIPATAAATFPVSYTTAHMALHAFGHLQAGETVLIHAAAGGVGLAAVQLAKAAGARVIAVAGGAGRAAAVLAQGADRAIDHRAQDWVAAVREATSKNGADVILDSIGGEVTTGNMRCLAHGGRLLILGFSSGTPGAIPANLLLTRRGTAIGVHWRPGTDAAAVGRAVADLVALYRTGAVRPVIDGAYDFETLPDAIMALAERRLIGKVVVTIP